VNDDAEQLSSEQLPWHDALRQRLSRAQQAGRLHHALLVSGLAGVGKSAFARHIAHLLFCRNLDSNGNACGTCRGCHLFLTGNHPDLHCLAPAAESKSGEISVDAVREMVEKETLSAQTGGYKVVIATPAEKMNRNAANALLKTLEEPASKTVLILVTAHPAQLLPTIRSRCQHWPIPLPDESMALTWLRQHAGQADLLLALRLAGGAPLAARQYIQAQCLAQRDAAMDAFLSLGGGKGDPVALTESWLKQDIPLLFEWLSGWVADMAKLSAGGRDAHLSNPDRAEQLAGLAQHIPNEQLHEYWRAVSLARQRLQTNLSAQLLLESLLVHWRRICARKGA
jgi:DNA polymerase-3 subunit delta'